MAAAEESFLPEEPDYAFVTGSPYTETKKFLQIILTNFFNSFDEAGITSRELNNFLRFEYGITDRLEADLVLNFNDQWNSGADGNSDAHGFGDTLLGLRYRILREPEFPITLSFGPQILLPGSFSKSFSSGGFGLAWDLTTGREWNRWFFHYLSLNYATTFAAKDPTQGSFSDFNLHNFNWGVALGFRPIEKTTRSGGRHDLHVTIEASGTFGQSVAAGSVQGFPTTDNEIIFVPGLRYGYITPKKFLAEVGLAGVIGLSSDSPDWGLILQTQWEFGF